MLPLEGSNNLVMEREWGEFGFEEFLEIKAVMGYAAKQKFSVFKFFEEDQGVFSP